MIPSKKSRLGHGVYNVSFPNIVVLPTYSTLNQGINLSFECHFDDKHVIRLERILSQIFVLGASVSLS